MGAFYRQDPFEAQIASNMHQPLNEHKEFLRRGYMIWDEQNLPPGYSEAARVLFLYNPTEVAASYTLQGNEAASYTQIFRNPQDTADLRVALQQAVSFTLLFDRTYAFWNGASGDMSLFGVDTDVRAMRQFTGMFVNNDQQANATGQAANLSQGIMGRINSYLHFAQGRQGLSYYGYVDSWDVTYTHFTNNMVPMRCSLDVSFTLLPPKTQTNNKKGNSGPGTITTTPGGGSGGLPTRPFPGPSPIANVSGR